MIYMYINNHILISSGYLIITVRAKSKQKLRTATMLFYVLQKFLFFKNCRNSKCQVPTLRTPLLLRSLHSHPVDATENRIVNNRRASSSLLARILCKVTLKCVSWFKSVKGAEGARKYRHDHAISCFPYKR
jgi:hypothetical protein